ncbi:MAG: hypothetical protein RLZZ230_958 [Candidatus Parcubacteria bacterium]|jgi:Leucine-rich repeat (LRR) protein
MQIFGLLSLVITIALAGWWLSASMGGTQAVLNEDGSIQSDSTYQQAIDSANKVAENVSADGTVLKGKKITIYDGLEVYSDVQVLDLSGKGMSGSLKAEIRQLTKLRQLDLSGNNFTGLPAEIGQLSKLEILNLSGNPLTGLPQELGNLRNLKQLNLKGTQYSAQDLDIIKSKLPAETKIMVD